MADHPGDEVESGSSSNRVEATNPNETSRSPFPFSVSEFRGETGSNLLAIICAISVYLVLGLWAFHTNSSLFRGFVVYAITVITVTYLIASKSWKTLFNWPGRYHTPDDLIRRRRLLTDMCKSLVAIVCMVVMFTIWSAAGHKFLTNLPFRKNENSMWIYLQGYLWNVTEAIPVIQINETLHWTVPALFGTRLGEAIELVFRILVIVPGFRTFARYVQAR